MDKKKKAIYNQLCKILYIADTGYYMPSLSKKTSSYLRIAAFGDIVGSAGQEIAKQLFSHIRETWGVDLIIANAENCSDGFGITPSHVKDLQNAGLDAITMGNHVWDKYALREQINNISGIVRPINLKRENPGTGCIILETALGPIAIMNALGQFFMHPADCPYHAVYDKVKKLASQKIKMIVLDFHAESTAEKMIMGQFLDGKVSLVWGTHTHVATADETILPAGTAYITDIGMTGSLQSVMGFKSTISMKRTIYGEPFKYQTENNGPQISTGIIVDIDRKTGLAVNIIRFKEISSNS